MSSGIPIPLIYDPAKRISQLRQHLDPNDADYQPIEQHENIRAAIKYIQDGTISSFKVVIVMNGRIVSEKEAIEKKGCVAWSEVRLWESSVLAFFFSWGWGWGLGGFIGGEWLMIE